jgi:hypothetical protein
MKYTVEMGLDAMVYIPSFMKISSAIQKLIRGYTDTQTSWRSGKPILIFQNNESRLKTTAQKGT